MWKLKSEGRGRRSTVISVSNGVATYFAGDFVDCDEFVGAIVAFKQGESDRSHEVQLLEFDQEDDELLATSLLKWYGLDILGPKLEKSGLRVRRAIDYHRHRHEVIEELPENVSFETAADLIKLSSTVANLFARPNTPKKRQSPRKHISSAGKDSSALNLPHLAYSDDELSDEELELVPARKRKNAPNLTSKLASASLDTPKKPPPSSIIFGDSRSSNETSKQEAKTPQVLLEDNGVLTPERSDSEQDIEGLEHPHGKEQGQEKLEETPINAAKEKSQMSSSRKGIRKYLPIAPPLELSENSIVDRASAALHPASDPPTHLCRDSQFDQLFLALETAIAAETGTCIYVSGTPGTGKSSIIREVIGQLDLRVHENELKPFTYLEINGMKLVHPSAAYEHLWEALGRGQMAASNAMTALEAAFSTPEPIEKRGVIVLLLDELDQLVTKGQQLMYNFFNWPSLPHSRLVVVAVANTMDLPERMLSNKISSRVGLTRIQFPGYAHQELKEIILQRLGQEDYTLFIENEAIEYAARKVAGVGGDARRVLDFLRQAVQLAASRNELPASVSHVRDISLGVQQPPLATFIKTLGVATKVLLCAILARARRTGSIESSLHDVLQQASQFVRSAANSDTLLPHLYPGRSGRLAYFQPAVMELVESGVLVQQAIKGEATPRVRLMVPVASIKEFLENDSVVMGMV